MCTKLFALSCVAALAAAVPDTQAPTIELDLAGVSNIEQYHPSADNVGVGCSVDPSLCRAARGQLRDGYSYVEKYSRQCPAGGATDITSCALPNAHAYDHQDGSLNVVKTIRLMNLDGTRCVPTTSDPEKCLEPAVNYARRSEYAIEYDATDKAGNRAEKLIFTLILNDHEAPAITPANGLPHVLESCDNDNLGQDTQDAARWLMPHTGMANDNIDGNVSPQMTVTITTPQGHATTKPQSDFATEGIRWLTIDTHKLGEWTVKYTAKDNAGFFGVNGVNNVNTYSRKVAVKDTNKPVVYCKAAKCAMEPGRVNAALRAKHADNAVVNAKTAEQCCHLCEQQQFRRKLGSIAHNHAPACGFFTFDSKNEKCYLMDKSLNLHQASALEQADGWQTGYPIQCQVQNEHECGSTFTDAGARCIDLRDSFDEATKQISDLLLKPKSSFATTPIQISSIGIQSIDYTCTDRSGLDAVKQTRYVTVRDTTPPKVSVIGQHTVEVSAGVTEMSVIDSYVQNAKCEDACDPNPTITTSFHRTSCDQTEIPSFPSKMIGVFAIKYTCTDATGLKHTACRKIVNQDKTDPVIALNNANHGDVLTVPAKASGSFLDAGATCNDAIDGQINENLVIKGDNIKLNRPGTYKITYECRDSSGNSATPLHKTVIVEDTVCPKCTLNGPAAENLEANFDYVEKGATCTDVIGYVDSAGVRHTDLAAEAVGAVNKAVPGVYTIEYRAKDGSGNWNTGAIHGEATKKCTGAQNKVTRIVTVVDSLRPVITLDYNNVPIHSGDASDTGHNNVANPAGDPSVNPYLKQQMTTSTSTMARNFQLMAEQGVSGANGWMLAALASAVAGVALLGYSRRAPVATSVPV